MRKEIEIGDKSLILIWKQFQDDVDIDKLLRINYRNLAAEILTFPVVMFKLQALLEDAEHSIRESELDLEAYKAKRTSEIRNELNDLKMFEKLTQDDIKYRQASMLQQDKVFRAKNKKLLKLKKQKGYLNAVYWSAKDKSGKLDRVTEKQHPDDLKYSLENIEDEFNGVLLRE